MEGETPRGLGITWSVVTGIPAPEVTSTSITVLAGHSIPHGAWAVDRCCWRYFFLKETVPFVIASNISTLSPPLQSDKQQGGSQEIFVHLSTTEPGHWALLGAWLGPDPCVVTAELTSPVLTS